MNIKSTNQISTKNTQKKRKKEKENTLIKQNFSAYQSIKEKE